MEIKAVVWYWPHNASRVYWVTQIWAVAWFAQHVSLYGECVSSNYLLCMSDVLIGEKHLWSLLAFREVRFVYLMTASGLNSRRLGSHRHWNTVRTHEIVGLTNLGSFSWVVVGGGGVSRFMIHSCYPRYNPSMRLLLSHPLPAWMYWVVIFNSDGLTTTIYCSKFLKL